MPVSDCSRKHVRLAAYAVRLPTSPSITRTDEGTIYPPVSGITLAPTWQSYAVPAMAGYMAMCQAGLESMKHVWTAVVRIENTTPTDTAQGASGSTMSSSRVDEGIVHAHSKVWGSRVDELWFVDLPNLEERSAIFRVHLSRNARSLPETSVALLAKQTEGFSGAEIEAVIVDAMYRAFDAEMPFSDELVLAAVRDTTPLSKTRQAECKALREWARGRARWATPEAGAGVGNEAGASRFANLGAVEL